MSTQELDQELTPNAITTDLSVTGMTCASCVGRVEKKLNKMPGVNAVVNLATEQARVQHSADVSPADLIATVEKAGYGATLVEQADESDSTESRAADLWRRFVISTAMMIPVMVLSMIPATQFAGWQWVTAVLGLIVGTWGAWPFHSAAFKAIRHGATTMDTLVSMGVIAALLWSFWALFWGGAGSAHYHMHMTGVHNLGGTPHLYFETATMIVSFLLLGRWLEARSRRQTGQALRALLDLGADHATVIRDGNEVTIPAAELEVGDIFVVRPGETVATDGVVETGQSAVDASILTGESVPVDVKPGDAITGATINSYGVLTVRATRVGDETTLASMGRLLTQAQTGKAPVQQLADRISAVFVPVVIGIALVVFALWWAIGGELEPAFTVAIAVLVVACPCALGLATPTALLAGSGRAAKLGALIKGPEILEDAHRATTIVLDKTGTLTTGTMTLDDANPDLVALAAAVEAGSEHPIARAIVEGAQGTYPTATDFRNEPGHGVSAMVDGALVKVGRPAWAGIAPPQEFLDAEGSGASAVVVVKNDEYQGTLAVRDRVRDSSKEGLATLREMGLTPVLLTGDNEAVARRVADELGIERVLAGVLPDGKLAEIQRLQAEGKRVAMVGDGVNDAAALAQADLSIAMGSGTDVAKAASDITIVNSDVRTIPTSLRISRRTLRIIKENLVWAFGYNLIAIPLAASGVLMPGIAAAAMASSSVIVVLNSLRLRNA